MLVYRSPESARKPQLKAPAAFWGGSRRSRRASRLSRTSNADRTVFSASFRIVDSGHVVRTLRGLTREYGRSILTGKANLGYCPICERRIRDKSVAGTHAKLKAELDGPTFEMASSVSRTVLGRGTSVMVRRRSLQANRWSSIWDLYDAQTCRHLGRRQ